jgi:hypothetical protein
MPTRKQRRRREKDFRHDVRVYEVDEEGNEVPIAELRAQDERAAKPKPKAKSKGSGRPARVQREAQPPSWERALKRGGMMGALMVVALYFVQGPVGSAIGVFYALAFVPLTYWLDRTKYRMDLKRTGRLAAAAKKR